MNEKPNIILIITNQQSHDIAGALRFNDAQVLKNKDRFLEETDFTDEWDIHTLQDGAEEQTRELFSKRINGNKSLGTFAWERDKDYHPDYFTGNRAPQWIEQ